MKDKASNLRQVRVRHDKDVDENLKVRQKLEGVSEPTSKCIKTKPESRDCEMRGGWDSAKDNWVLSPRGGDATPEFGQ